MSLSNLKAVQWQRAFERRCREQRQAHIIDVARKNPDLPLWALVERFGMERSAMRKLLEDHGLDRKDDDVLTYRDSLTSGGIRGGPFNGWHRTDADVAVVGRRRAG